MSARLIANIWEKKKKKRCLHIQIITHIYAHRAITKLNNKLPMLTLAQALDTLLESSTVALAASNRL